MKRLPMTIGMLAAGRLAAPGRCQRHPRGRPGKEFHTMSGPEITGQCEIQPLSHTSFRI
jgi:hypothetical protein